MIIKQLLWKKSKSINHLSHYEKINEVERNKAENISLRELNEMERFFSLRKLNAVGTQQYWENSRNFQCENSEQMDLSAFQYEEEIKT
jgi:hypothetical protein